MDRRVSAFRLAPGRGSSNPWWTLQPLPLGAPLNALVACARSAQRALHDWMILLILFYRAYAKRRQARGNKYT